jgi:hypothetical protein
MPFETRRVVRGGALLAAAGVCACVPTQGRSAEDGVFTSEGIASVTSFQCAQTAVTGLGYAVNWFDGGQQTLRAERRFEGSAEAYRGYLTVTVTDEQSGRHLLVRAERYAGGSSLPIPSLPPTPSPTPNPPPPRPAARRGTRRVEPGPVATDARNVVRRCALAGERSFGMD